MRPPAGNGGDPASGARRPRLRASHALRARAIEDKLKHASRVGGYLVLTCEPRHAGRAQEKRLGRFPLQRLSVDRLMLDAMREEPARLNVSWPVVLAADAAARDSRDFKNLLRLAAKAAPALRARVMALIGPTLLTDPGLLARYGLMSLSAEMQVAGGAVGPPAVWLLVPQDGAGLPMIDAEPVPVIAASQWERLTDAWLSNAHRAAPAPPPDSTIEALMIALGHRPRSPGLRRRRTRGSTTPAKACGLADALEETREPPAPS